MAIGRGGLRRVKPGDASRFAPRATHDKTAISICRSFALDPIKAGKIGYLRALATQLKNRGLAAHYPLLL